MASLQKTVYLDHAATTAVDPRVVERMVPYLTEYYGNPSSIYSLGRESHKALDEAREIFASFLGCKPMEIVFTGCGSESDNLAIKGAALAQRNKGNHIITSAIEHHAVLHTCQYLEKFGFEVTYLPVDQYGQVHPADVERAITDKTILVSIMYANNEIGTIQPVAEIGEICRSRRVPFHTDAVQAGGVLSLNVSELNVDLLSLSAHKFYGPKGIGILYVRQGTRILPQQQGGTQERNRRAGTENIAGIVGAAEAIKLAYKEGEEANARERNLRDELITRLTSFPGVHLTGHPSNRLPNSASFRIDSVEGESLLLGLDVLGIAASAGSACTSGSTEPSHVLTALGLSTDESRGALRLTLGKNTTYDEIEFVCAELPKLVVQLRSLVPVK